MKTLFSHPDYTVGFGISPNQLPMQVADYTAGGEFRPAPKNHFIVIYMLKLFILKVNSFIYFLQAYRLLPHHLQSVQEYIFPSSVEVL